jgi:hypothetical protein
MYYGIALSDMGNWSGHEEKPSVNLTAEGDSYKYSYRQRVYLLTRLLVSQALNLLFSSSMS